MQRTVVISVLCLALSSLVLCHGLEVRWIDNCYYFDPKLSQKQGFVTWNEAEAKCQLFGAHLASILSLAEESLISRFLRDFGQTNQVWIGGRVINDSNRWSDGETWTHSPHVTLSYPRNSSCFSIDPWTKSIWYVEDCDTKRLFLCKKKCPEANKPQPHTTVVQVTTAAPFEWSQNDEFCYHFSSNKTNWTDADGWCKSHNANLASIHSTREELWMFGHMWNRSISTSVWSGGRYMKVGNAFLWSDETPWDYGMEKMQPYQSFPDDPIGCVNLDATKKDEWFVDPCSYEKQFICKKVCD